MPSALPLGCLLLAAARALGDTEFCESSRNFMNGITANGGKLGFSMDSTCDEDSPNANLACTQCCYVGALVNDFYAGAGTEFVQGIEAFKSRALMDYCVPEGTPPVFNKGLASDVAIALAAYPDSPAVFTELCPDAAATMMDLPHLEIGTGCDTAGTTVMSGTRVLGRVEVSNGTVVDIRPEVPWSKSVSVPRPHQIGLLMLRFDCDASLSPPPPPTTTEQKHPFGDSHDEHGCMGGAGYSWCPVTRRCQREWRQPCTPHVQVGGHRDMYGCIPTAGYTWCNATGTCVREWEEPCELKDRKEVVVDEHGCILSVGETWCASSGSGKCNIEWETPCEVEHKATVGNVRDKFGCIPSAGYTWCPSASKCVRTWETPCASIAPDTPATQEDKHGCLGSAGYKFCASSNSCTRSWHKSCQIGSNESDVVRDHHGCLTNKGYSWCESSQSCIRLSEDECSCYSLAMSYQPINNVFTQPGSDERTIEETYHDCKKRCLGTRGCEYFNYWFDGGCHLSSSESKPQTEWWVISGPARCTESTDGSETFRLREEGTSATLPQPASAAAAPYTLLSVAAAVVALVALLAAVGRSTLHHRDSASGTRHTQLL